MGTGGYQRPAVDYSGFSRGREKLDGGRRLLVPALFLIFVLLLFFFLMWQFPLDSFFLTKEKNGEKEEPLVPGSMEMRKNIYDRNLESMAVSFQLVSIYARPLELTDIKGAAETLAPVLGRDPEELYGNLKTERTYEWLAKHVSPALAEKVMDLDLPGVYFSYENERFYPHNSLGAHILGFVNDEQGLAGVESYYDARLRSRIARELAGVGQDVSPREASRPGHLVLTMDARVQALLEDELRKLVHSTGAEQAMAALMAVDSGAVVALANVPAFDPNCFWQSSPEALDNSIVSERIRPGVLNRLFMLAADIRDGRVSWEEPAEMAYFAGKELAPRMRKKRINGPLPMQWHRFGGDLLGSPELADFESEVRPDALAALSLSLGFDKDRQLDLSAARMKGVEKKGNEDDGGYLFADDNDVTGLSLLTGFTWLVNGGHQVKPYLLRETITNDGQRELLSHPYGQLAGYSEEMSWQFTSFLADKVQPGRKFYFAQSLIPLYRGTDSLGPGQDGPAVTGAETGPELFQTTLLGMGPVAGPRLSMVVVLNKAKVDLTSSSPGRKELNGFMAQAESLLDKAAAGSHAQPPQLDREEIYKRWRAGRTSPSFPGSDVGPAFDRMPDLRGYSLRKALQALQPARMRITVHGAGRVSSQLPRPGAEIGGDECVLTLSMDE